MRKAMSDGLYQYWKAQRTAQACALYELEQAILSRTRSRVSSRAAFHSRSSRTSQPSSTFASR